MMQVTDMVTRSSNAQNITYVLHDNNTFFFTGYKVLRGSGQDTLIKCAKYNFNGKVKLLYYSAPYSSLASIRPRLNESTYLHILVSILSTIVEVRKNGFLETGNIDASPETIFIDRATLEAHLVYLPLTNQSGEDRASLFNNELRSNLITIIAETPALGTETMRYVGSLLANTVTDFPELLNTVRSLIDQSSESIAVTEDLTSQTESGSTVYLSALDATRNLNFTIDKPEFIIGKVSGAVDAAIPDNRAVSRRHCKIIQVDGSWFVVDLGSSNGTYLNDRRLLKDSPGKLEDGGVLRIADCGFRVTIR